MASFQDIQNKLEEFIRKYYTNELLKGAILFFAIGLLYFLIVLLVEYIFWLPQAGRTVLFWVFIAVEVVLFARFIVFPLAKLFKLQKGIDYDKASHIIGNHFPEVSDKLLNVLQLNKNTQQSELLLASIDQKSAELQPIPFQKAVTFKSNIKYLKYAAIPIAIYLLVTLTGNNAIFSGSYTRVVNYSTAYTPPAPFAFFVTNDSLQAIERKDFTLKVRTAGDAIPQNAAISYQGETYYLQQTAPGEFQYTFSQPVTSIDFQLKANSVVSAPYHLEVLPVPSLVSFKMGLDYPSYTKKNDESLSSTGNATIPEGTRVNWTLVTKQTDLVVMKSKDTTEAFQKEEAQFTLQKTLYRPFDYELSTSNDFLKDYENLAFTLNVVKDQHPEIAVEAKQDTIDTQITYFRGRVSDDYGLSKLRLVYYPQDDDKAKQYKPIAVNSSNFDQFMYVFPEGLVLQEGQVYSYYFEVFDNDAVNGAKSSRSMTFSHRKMTREELEKQQLQEQSETIKDLDETLKNFDEQKKALDELTKTQREKQELNWNDKQKMEAFIKRQKQQEEMMKSFSEKLKNNLNEFQKDSEEKDPFKEQLQERLEENEEKAKENERLLEELERLKDKIEKEELIDKLEQISKQNKNQQRNLEQLLELTKRYYVEKKAQKLAEELQKMAEEQEALSEAPANENTQEKQEQLNEQFDAYREEMKELQEENQDLQQPMDIPDQSFDEEAVQQEQQEASENLEQNNQEGAQQNQKSAAQKMKEMSSQMGMQLMAGAQQGAQEDIEVLRQILDNLVVFSHNQEGLMEQFRQISFRHPQFGDKLILQHDLKQNFQQVDDSLFALALRNPMIGNTVNEHISEAHYNIEKSLENFAENRFSKATANQQYTVTSTNDLAVLLADALKTMQMQMQMQMSGAGSGQGKQGQGPGFQLPDIIQKQESLNQQMQEGMQPGKGQKGQQGEQSQGEGEQGKEGEGSKGEQGQNGQQEGSGGSNGGQGSQGKDGSETQSLGDSEEMSGKLYEIYMQQQLLRMQLEDRIRQEGLPPDAEKLTRQMEQIEQELLERGFNETTLKRMNEIKHELLKLDKAVFQQGEKEERQGRTNQEVFDANQKKLLENASKYFNTTEILNRQALPLRQMYQEKVQHYFNTTND